MTTRPMVLDPQAQPRTPRQRRSREKRERLTTAALALFAERGYAATSIENLASRADLAVGTVYQHVRSKRDLLLSLMADLIGHLEQAGAAFNPSADRQSVIRGLFQRALTNDHAYGGVVRAWQEAAPADADLVTKDAAIHAWMTDHIQRTLELVHSLPGARSSVDIPGLATVVEALFWRVLTLAMSGSERDRERWINAATHFIHHAMFTDRPARSVSWRRRARRS